MRSSIECSAKADDLEAVARSCDGALAANYLSMAADWRRMARQTAWQEKFEAQNGPPLH